MRWSGRRLLRRLFGNSGWLRRLGKLRRLRSDRFAAQANTKVRTLEFKFRQAIVTQKRNQLAELVHVYGRSRATRRLGLLVSRTSSPGWCFALFFGC